MRALGLLAFSCFVVPVLLLLGLAAIFAWPWQVLGAMAVPVIAFIWYLAETDRKMRHDVFEKLRVLAAKRAAAAAQHAQQPEDAGGADRSVPAFMMPSMRYTLMVGGADRKAMRKGAERGARLRRKSRPQKPPAAPGEGD